jgi:hypothetical protein
VIGAALGALLNIVLGGIEAENNISFLQMEETEPRFILPPVNIFVLECGIYRYCAVNSHLPFEPILVNYVWNIEIKSTLLGRPKRRQKLFLFACRSVQAAINAEIRGEYSSYTQSTPPIHDIYAPRNCMCFGGIRWLTPVSSDPHSGALSHPHLFNLILPGYGEVPSINSALVRFYQLKADEDEPRYGSGDAEKSYDHEKRCVSCKSPGVRGKFAGIFSDYTIGGSVLGVIFVILGSFYSFKTSYRPLEKSVPHSEVLAKYCLSGAVITLGVLIFFWGIGLFAPPS